MKRLTILKVFSLISSAVENTIILVNMVCTLSDLNDQEVRLGKVDLALVEEVKTLLIQSIHQAVFHLLV